MAQAISSRFLAKSLVSFSVSLSICSFFAEIIFDMFWYQLTISWTSTLSLVEIFQSYAALQLDFFFLQISSRTTSPATCVGWFLGDLRCPLPTSPKICKLADLRTSSQDSACVATAMTCKQSLSWSCSWLLMTTIQWAQPLPQPQREARCMRYE